MDLDLSPEQESFRDEVREWLRADVPKEPLPSTGTREGFDAHRAWERTLASAGYGAIRWPEEYGGRGLDVVHQAIFEEEYLLAGGPERITVVGHNLLGPALMAHGTDEQRSRWLPGILSADVIWSQGFSEPEAGSDLAGLRCKAVRDGDDWVVDGQKIWTSYGPFADSIFALVRTDPDAERHRGITVLGIDMRSDGVEARPIIQIDGHAGFAQVFFTGVRVPHENVIGEVDGGWAVALAILGFERDSPAAPAAAYLREVRELAAVARTRGLDQDPVTSDALAKLFVRAEAYRAYTLRTLTRLASGESLGSEASVTKLLWSELERDLYETGRDVLGPYGETLSDAPVADQAGWNSRYWFARAATIYAGTSEIQRNIVAERVLGLPRG
ncbi:MAG: acyl-CoA dehydrogenase family protein [Actinomycetota bacterium]